MPGPFGSWSWVKVNTYAWLDKATKHGTWSKLDQDIYDFTERFNPFISQYKNEYERERYLDRYNIDYSEIKQPWNLPGGSSASTAAKLLSRSVGMVSHNLSALYDEDDPEEVHRRKLMEKYYRADFRR